MTPCIDSKYFASVFFLILAILLAGCAQRMQVRSLQSNASLMNEAMQAYTREDCRESIRLFTSAVQAEEHPALYNGLGMAQMQCGQAQDAVENLQKAVTLAPNSAALLSNLGTAYFALGDDRNAERRFDAALKLNSMNAEALVGKAGVLLRQKRPSEALATLGKIRGPEANAPEVRYNRALALYDLDLATDAENSLNDYLNEYPNDAEALNALGVILLRAGKTDAALQNLNKAIQLKPEEGVYYYNRSAVQKKKKAFQAAEQDCTRALAYTPDLVTAYVDRGDLRFLLNKPEAACQDLEKACDMGLCERLKKYQATGRCRNTL